MEYLDILDEKGNKTGNTKGYDEVHKSGLWHEGNHVWFVNSKNEILLQHRSATKRNYPSLWDISAAGHISAGEDAKVSALREIKEELGIEISTEDLKLIGRIAEQAVLNKGTYIDNEYDNIYLVKKDIDIKQIKMTDGEVDDVKWLPIHEFIKWLADQNEELVPHPNEYKILIKALENI